MYVAQTTREARRYKKITGQLPHTHTTHVCCCHGWMIPHRRQRRAQHSRRWCRFPPFAARTCAIPAEVNHPGDVGGTTTTMVCPREEQSIATVAGQHRRCREHFPNVFFKLDYCERMTHCFLIHTQCAQPSQRLSPFDRGRSYTFKRVHAIIGSEMNFPTEQQGVFWR